MFKRIEVAVRSIFRKRAIEQELDKELQFHLEHEIEKNIEVGMSPSEARCEAIRSFGGMDLFKEQCREVRGVSLIESLASDIRFGFRVLVKSPVFTSLAVITLALGIGANTSIFSVIYGVLMRPLPYKQGHQLVVLHQQATLMQRNDVTFSVHEVNDYRDMNHTLTGVVEHHTMSFILYGKSEPERVETAVVSANFFDVLGVSPLLGRTFVPGDDVKGANAVLILSYKYWQKGYGGDPKIIGKVFQMNNRPHTVIGVLPPVPQYPTESDVYMPSAQCPTRASDSFISHRDRRMMTVFGRLKPGVTVEEARADIASIASHLQQQYPAIYPANVGYSTAVTPLTDDLTGQARPTLWVLLATACLVLSLACANVANLMLARLMKRDREVAVRIALGAGRGRLVRQLLTESTMLSLAGGVLGLIFAWLGMDLLVSFAAKFTTRAAEIKIDGSVLIFTLVVSILTGIAFGLVPAFSSSRNLASGLKDGGSHLMDSLSNRGLRNLLIVAQVSVSFILLIGAGLMLRSLIKLQNVNAGFTPEKVLVLSLSPNWSKYENEQYRTYFQKVIDKVKSDGGVESVAAGTSYPLNAYGIHHGPDTSDFQIEGQPLPGELPPTADWQVVSTNYFHTLKIPLIRGRLFMDSDNANSDKVAVINQSMARHRWNDADPIGSRITFDQGRHWIAIIGIVGDVKQFGLNHTPSDEIYGVLAQNTWADKLLVRTSDDPKIVFKRLRNTIYAVDPETAITDEMTLDQVKDESLATQRLTTILLALFAGLAIVITASGIAGVMALSVSQRTHELGIRMALGASQLEILRMVVGQGMALVLIGLVVGIAGALAVTKMMANLLYAITPTDPATFLSVSIVLITVAAMAALIPASRVTSIDPVTALKSE